MDYHLLLGQVLEWILVGRRNGEVQRIRLEDAAELVREQGPSDDSVEHSQVRGTLTRGVIGEEDEGNSGG